MKRPEHIIEDLITRQLDGTPLTDTERRELQEWLEASEANRDAFLRAYKAWGNARLAETRFNTGKALENVMARDCRSIQTPVFPAAATAPSGHRIAAAACVMLAVVGYYRLQPSTVPDIEMFIRQPTPPYSPRKRCNWCCPSRKPSCPKPKNRQSVTIRPPSGSTTPKKPFPKKRLRRSTSWSFPTASRRR